MYEVFLNERRIVIARKVNMSFVKGAVIAENLNSVNEVSNWFKEFTLSISKSAILFHPEPEYFWKNVFLPAFISVPAAGGVVIRNNKLLFIYRNEKWDLPKGKIDTGESPEAAAIREVEEECGVKGHDITKKLPSTFHIYQSPYGNSLGKWILKETHWFEMIYKGSENGTPQTDENITEIRWFAGNELNEVFVNTYENLKPVISLYNQ